ncbi:triose-phosphate isomerase [Cellulomonas timonensis]|uniref:triose-phosphate isomerase n=1 Tax=Cellulomonas timonensis TaxID=1689271 RepID=UPI000AC20BB9|nr:triose-phosphate isomerase [Cellulomonas timonensis]
MAAGATWVGTSWKMTKTLAESVAYARALAAVDSSRWAGTQPFIIPPATALAAVRDTLGHQSQVLLGAQNAHWEDAGAWTGELSVPQVADAGARLVEIGHSERREHFGETDHTVNLKVRAALRHGVRPLVCVGESDQVFRSGGSVEHVRRQARAALAGVGDPSQVLIAYEPVWAIGAGGRSARPEDIAEVFAALRAEFGSAVEGLLYGGSVTLGNAAQTLKVPAVDGLFVGRAAWAVDDFIALLDHVSGLSA